MLCEKKVLVEVLLSPLSSLIIKLGPNSHASSKQSKDEQLTGPMHYTRQFTFCEIIENIHRFLPQIPDMEVLKPL